ncbi:MAG: hypothetical protein KatS3mg076_3082 [Candidatus Binatia bacterium]|nr:MAG: hypothetical protein KatS3mg076_3082 [Candidatus Binatia bacterium]
MSLPPPPEGVREAFELQAHFCGVLGSPLYERLLRCALADFVRGGAVARVFEGWSGHAMAQAVVLRLLGGVHALVLSGEEKELARFFPSAGGGPGEGVEEAFLDCVGRNVEFLRRKIREPVQTNEVGRSAALLGGFLEIARRTRLPLRCLEIGASAGLNLWWDRYRYELGPYRWGDPASSVRLTARWAGPPPPLESRVEVAARAGCDPAPVDLRDPAARLRLESFVWPDQVERFSVLRAAIAHASANPPAVEKAPGSQWLSRVLLPLPRGLATVVYHSIVWWYLGEEERQKIAEILARAASEASASAPLAWLRLEHFTSERPDLLCTFWPGGEEKTLARAHPHGFEVEWLVP